MVQEIKVNVTIKEILPLLHGLAARWFFSINFSLNALKVSGTGVTHDDLVRERKGNVTIKEILTQLQNQLIRCVHRIFARWGRARRLIKDVLCMILNILFLFHVLICFIFPICTLFTLFLLVYGNWQMVNNKCELCRIQVLPWGHIYYMRGIN